MRTGRPFSRALDKTNRLCAAGFPMRRLTKRLADKRKPVAVACSRRPTAAARNIRRGAARRLCPLCYHAHPKQAVPSRTYAALSAGRCLFSADARPRWSGFSRSAADSAFSSATRIGNRHGKRLRERSPLASFSCLSHLVPPPLLSSRLPFTDGVGVFAKLHSKPCAKARILGCKEHSGSEKCEHCD